MLKFDRIAKKKKKKKKSSVRTSEIMKQESRAAARQPRNAETILFGLKFANAIHYKLRCSQASISKPRLRSSKIGACTVRRGAVFSTTVMYGVPHHSHTYNCMCCERVIWTAMTFGEKN